MPGLAGRRRTRTSSGDLLSAPTTSAGRKSNNKVPRLEVEEDPELIEAFDDGSVLCRSLKQCGLVVRKGKTPNLLLTDQEVFLKKFKREMAILTEEELNTVKTTVEGWVEKQGQEFLKKCLQETVTSATCNTARSQNQDSLMKLLLNTPATQTQLLRWILEQLALISLDEEEMLQSQHSQIPRLILRATRYLNRIEEEEGLTQALIDIMIGCSSFIQVEVISALPEILPDGQHPAMAVHLNTMLDEVRPHTASIVDCLSNLTLSREASKQAREGVLRRLPTIAQQDLPAVLDFLLASIFKDEAADVISEIRAGLNLTGRMEASQRLAKGSEKRRQEEGAMSVERLVLDKIRVTVAREKWMGEAWLEAIKTGEEGLCLDLLLMVMMYKMPRHTKAVEVLMKAKSKAGLLGPDLVATTMTQHKETISLRSHLQSMIALAECAVVSKDEEVASLGDSLFSEAFRRLGGGDRQELVAALVGRASEGPGEGRVASLKVLSNLVENQGEEIGLYAIFLTQLLDTLDTFEQNEVELVMKILCGLAWGGGSRGEGIRDQLVITVKKQLASYNEVVQRRGVVGAVAAIAAMLKLHRKDQGEISLPLAESSRGELRGFQREARELLATAQCRVDRSAGVSALLVESLEKLVRSDEAISKDFLSRLQGEGVEDNSLAQVFENDYLPDIDQEKEARLHFPVETRYSLDDQDNTDNDSMEQEPAIVHILTLSASLLGQSSLCASSKISPLQQASEPQVLACRLPSSLRLLCTVSQRLEGSLKEVDALASCGLRMPSLASTEDLTSVNREERPLVLNSLFLAYNWFVEVINAFSKNEETEKEVVVARLRHLLEVRDQLQAGLRHCPGFRPPLAGGKDTSAWSTAPVKTAKTKGKGGKGKSGKKAKKPTEQTLNATLHLNTQSQTAGPQQQSVTLAPPPSVDFNHYQPFLRHLDLPALLALISSGALNLGRGEDSGLRVQELLFLLTDLRHQLQASLASVVKAFPGGRGRPGTKSASPSTSKLSPQEVAAIIVPDVKYIAAHMDNIAKHFQQIIDLQDGVVDGAEMFSSTSLLLAFCLEEGLAVLHILLSSAHMNAHLSSLLASLSPTTRFSTSPPSSPLADLANSALSHLSSFFTSAAITPSVAASHLKLLKAVATHSSTSPHLSKVASSYLGKDWRNEEGEREKGGKYGKQVEAMLEVYLEGSQPLDRVEKIQEEGIEQVVGESKESESWPTISRSTCAVVYKTLLSTVVNEAKKVVFNPRSDQDSQFNKWERLVGLFNRFTESLKKWCNLAILAALLKLGRRFLEHFTKHGVPLVEKLFTGGFKRRNSCIQLIKTFQQSTRYMQNVCCHSKLTASVSLANHVPLVKRALEVFVYRAKAMLAANNCSEAFSLGTLVNRDLQGNQLQLSQLTVDEEEEDEEEEEEEEEGEGGEEESDEEEQNSRVRRLEDYSHMSEEY